MKFKLPIITLLVAIVLAGGYFYSQESNMQNPTVESPAVREERKNNGLELIFQGVTKPHGLGFHGGILAVSSEQDKALYLVEEGKPKKIADLDFAHDMVFGTDETIVTAVFNENRVVAIRPNGEIKELTKDLAGPNGITRDARGNWYVSNFRSGEIVRFGTVGSPEVIAKKLSGPAGLVFDNSTSALFVANNKSGDTITVISDGKQSDVKYPGLKNIESLGLLSNGDLVGTAVENGKAVVARFYGNEAYDVLLGTDLPAPLVGHFTADDEVYLVSPSDAEGRIYRIKLK